MINCMYFSPDRKHLIESLESRTTFNEQTRNRKRPGHFEISDQAFIAHHRKPTIISTSGRNHGKFQATNL
jgi:hypothetical protein